MNESLKDNWNSIVQPDDTVYVVGDFAYKMASRLSSYVTPLNGHKHLIMGNHDRLPRIEYEQHFESVHDYLKLEINKQVIILFHYPILSWEKRARGSWHLYGHVHNAGQLVQLENRKAWNVCVDVNEFKPISFDQLSKIMITRNVETSES